MGGSCVSLIAWFFARILSRGDHLWWTFLAQVMVKWLAKPTVPHTLHTNLDTRVAPRSCPIYYIVIGDARMLSRAMAMSSFLFSAHIITSPQMKSMKLAIPSHFISWKNTISDYCRKCVLPNMIRVVPKITKCGGILPFMDFTLRFL